MRTAEVKKLSTIDRFLYWIEERHSIHLRRQAGKSKPWTDDEILQNYFFTNPYRENDKVTRWFKEIVRDPLRDRVEVVMATIIFRWFNYIPTGELLWHYGDGREGVGDLLTNWNKKIALKILGDVRAKGGQVFTGAYIINSPAGVPKLEATCDRIDVVWNDREQLYAFFEDDRNWRGGRTLAKAHKALLRYPGMGGFMCYEVVCDLRYTAFLENAVDKLTWCNPGPGAIRGICRVYDIPFTKGKNNASPPKIEGWNEKTQELLTLVSETLTGMPSFEMREIEHSLCEFDKYERLLWQDGRPKRKYNGIK